MSGALLAAGLGGAAGLGLSLRFNWWRKRRSGTPILMYHQVGAPRSGSELNKWRVKEEDFRWQLDALLRRGYRGAALRELEQAIARGERMPPEGMRIEDTATLRNRALLGAR